MAASSRSPDSVVGSLVRDFHEDIPSMGWPRGRPVGTHALDQSHHLVSHNFRLLSIPPISSRIKLVLGWSERHESGCHSVPRLRKLAVER